MQLSKRRWAVGAVVGRRDFLKGRLSAGGCVRPPDAIAERDFLARCDGCGKCVEACPQHIVKLVDHAARLDFSLGEGVCTFCQDCTTACPTGALKAGHAEPRTWHAELIRPTCLSLQGTICRVCGDMCEAGAIQFRPLSAGREDVLIDIESCTGCGACSAGCPVSAIRFAENPGNLSESVQ
ncbi:MAG: ferredoxin-type protein NapF [Alphaproteobacteria bacterium]